MIKRMFKEPLVHFLLAGAAIFLLSALRGNDGLERQDKIFVTSADIERLSTLWEATWNRPPSARELEVLIGEHVKEEIYTREAIALGLDIDDAVIRRRLAQKMEFLAVDSVDVQSPGAGEVEAFFKANAENYTRGAVYDLQQIYFKSDNRQSAIKAVATLNAGGAPDGLGDVFALPSALVGASEQDIQRRFGSQFYAWLDDLPSNVWSGPIASGLGLHIVRISAKTPPGPPPFDQVQTAVLADWRNAQKIKAEADMYKGLRTLYEVEIAQSENAQ